MTSVSIGHCVGSIHQHCVNQMLSLQGAMHACARTLARHACGGERCRAWYGQRLAPQPAPVSEWLSCRAGLLHSKELLCTLQNALVSRGARTAWLSSHLPPSPGNVVRVPVCKVDVQAALHTLQPLRLLLRCPCLLVLTLRQSRGRMSSLVQALWQYQCLPGARNNLPPTVTIGP